MRGWKRNGRGTWGPLTGAATLALSIALVALLAGPLLAAKAPKGAKAATPPPPPAYEFNDVHFHLTNYVQEGIDVHDFLKIIGARVGRSALLGTDTVAPKDPQAYYAVYDMWKPVFDKLTQEAKDKILKGNYERIFDQGRKNVRAWEQAHASQH